jgi:prevent-host-death family protein
MEPVDLLKAKAQFSKLVRLAEQGQDVVIARDGKPVARLTRLQPAMRTIRYGLPKGKIHISDDFDAPLPPKVLADFEGR